MGGPLGSGLVSRTMAESNQKQRTNCKHRVNKRRAQRSWSARHTAYSLSVGLHVSGAGQKRLRDGVLPHEATYADSLFIQEHPHCGRVHSSVPHTLQRHAPPGYIIHLRPQEYIRDEEISGLKQGGWQQRGRHKHGQEKRLEQRLVLACKGPCECETLSALVRRRTNTEVPSPRTGDVAWYKCVRHQRVQTKHSAPHVEGVVAVISEQKGVVNPARGTDQFEGTK